VNARAPAFRALHKDQNGADGERDRAQHGDRQKGK
jgi:hypothetical protein